MAIVPNDRDLLNAVAIAIATSPYINGAYVTHPLDPTIKIGIDKIKLYGGREINEPGLTLAIYPDMITIDRGIRGYLAEEPISLVPNNSSEATFLMTANFVAELSLQISNYDEPLTLTYGKQDLLVDVPSDALYYGGELPFLCEVDRLQVVVMPAEEILREWSTALRSAIRRIRYFPPYRARSLQVVGVSYDSAKIFETEDPEALVFHRARVHFRLMYTEGNETIL